MLFPVVAVSPLFPGLFSISISIFKRADTGQRWPPFQPAVDPDALIMKPVFNSGGPAVEFNP